MNYIHSLSRLFKLRSVESSRVSRDTLVIPERDDARTNATADTSTPTLRQEWPFVPSRFQSTHLSLQRRSPTPSKLPDIHAEVFECKLQRLAADDDADVCIAGTSRCSPGSATSRHLGINAVISSTRGNSSVGVYFPPRLL